MSAFEPTTPEEAQLLARLKRAFAQSDPSGISCLMLSFVRHLSLGMAEVLADKPLEDLVRSIDSQKMLSDDGYVRSLLKTASQALEQATGEHVSFEGMPRDDRHLTTIESPVTLGTIRSNYMRLSARLMIDGNFDKFRQEDQEIGGSSPRR